MSLTRQQKEATVTATEAALTEATSTVFMTHDAMGVDDVEELRDKLFAEGISLRVVPKRLLKIAAAKAGIEFDPTKHEGQFAIAWGNDLVAPARVLYDFAKERETVSLVGGVMEGAVISAEQVDQLAKLPSRDELLGQLVSVLQGPLRGLHGALSGMPRSLVYVVQAVAETKEKA